MSPSATELPLADFQPLSVRDGQSKPFRLTETLSKSAASSLWDLIRHHIDDETARLIRAALRLDRIWVIQSVSDSVNLDFTMESSKTLGLDILDWMVNGNTDDAFVTGADQWLVEIGSVWSASRRGLERRVSHEAQTAYLNAVQQSGALAEHLSKAWKSAFSRTPDPTAAWHAAVKAVELLLQPIVSPKDSQATLDKMRKALSDKPSKWQFVGSTDDDDGVHVFIHALDLITYEPGRHGPDPKRATIEQARAVVLQAVTVVEWLREGLLTVR